MYGIFTLIGLVGALATSFLPESYKQPLPECVDDIDNANKSTAQRLETTRFKNYDCLIFEYLTFKLT